MNTYLMHFSYCKTISSVIMASAGALVVGYLYWYRQLQYKRPKYELPERWTAIGRVSKLLIYPIKSGYYKELDCANCQLRGMEQIPSLSQEYILRDRNFVLFDKSKEKFITAKCYEQLVLVEMSVKDEETVEFNIRHDITPALVINVNKVRSKAQLKSFKMHFNEVVKAFDCGDEASDWFSMFLLNKTNRNIRLGMCCDYKRTIANSWDSYTQVYNLLSDEDTGRFSDITSYMIVNEESVNDLNTRVTCGEKFTSYHFRPNIVVKNCIPYEEDTWDWMKIGDAIFRVVKPCTRCIAITFNPETAVKNPALEPIRTLRTYRRLGDIDHKAKHLEGHSPVMGVYAGLYHPGCIRTNDIVFVASQQR